MRIPPVSKIIVLAKGAIAALAAFLGVTADSKHPDSKHPVPFFIQVCTRKSRPLRKIKYSKCCGKLALKTKSRLLTLLRSTLSVLKNVSIFFPANETSVTVGSSGSVHYRTNLTIEDVWSSRRCGFAWWARYEVFFGWRMDEGTNRYYWYWPARSFCRGWWRARSGRKMWKKAHEIVRDLPLWHATILVEVWV